MQLSNIYLAYFSATYTTAKIARLVAGQLKGEIKEYNVTQTVPGADISLEENDLLVMAAPVYGGRIPATAAQAFNRFKGKNTPAILLCVYGNRDYDDALLEMKVIAENNGFRPLSAAAFIAQHSIFPEVGKNRPDEADIDRAKAFGQENRKMITELAGTRLLAPLAVKGNQPYKIPRAIPLRPKGNRQCNKCGKCVRLCPVKAIPAGTPSRTDKKKCISCGRCIMVCPKQARDFRGLLYKLVKNKFVKAYSARKEPETLFASCR